MSKVTVTLSQGPSIATPGGVPYGNTLITLTDGAGAGQTATVNGKETPPWTAEFDDVDLSTGAGTVTAQDQDGTGLAMGTPVSISVPSTATGGGGTAPTYTPTTLITATVS